MQIEEVGNTYIITGSIGLHDLSTLQIPPNIILDLKGVTSIDSLSVVFLRNSGWQLIPPRDADWAEINRIIDQQLHTFNKKAGEQNYGRTRESHQSYIYTFVKGMIDGFGRNTKLSSEIMWMQIYQIGWKTMPAVLIIGCCAGVGLPFQLLRRLEMFGIDSMLPSLVVIMLTSQLGPIIGGQIMAAQCASAITGDLALSRANQEWDAFIVNGHDPYHCLCWSRIYACIIMFIVVLFFVTFIALLTSAIFMSFKLVNTSFKEIIGQYILTLNQDIGFFMLSVRALIFGILTSAISVYIGCTAKLTEGIGICVNKSVYYSSFILIIVHIIFSITLLLCGFVV